MHTDQFSASSSFERDGFLLLKSVLSENEIAKLIDGIEQARLSANSSAATPGVRHLLKRSWAVRRVAKSAALRGIAKRFLGAGAKPVKAILFDKTPASNWYVTWHQDMTIAVKKKIEMDEFGHWSIKDGIPHVQPPVGVLDNMLSLRIHLDDCPATNGAIKFIPATQSGGILTPSQVASYRDEHKSVCVEAQKGDVIMMRPLILHSSSQSTSPDHRRVLHIEYAGGGLPGGLEWAESSGLDSVELIMALEEEFGLEIPNHDAEHLTTVGETYDYFCARLGETSPIECLSQKMFYKLRRALIENYNVNRLVITPKTKLSEILSSSEVEEGWPFLQLFIDLETPDFKTSQEIFGWKFAERELTLRELVVALIDRNAETLLSTPGDDIWHRLVNVIVAQLNVNRAEVVPGASFARDLGVC